MSVPLPLYHQLEEYVKKQYDIAGVRLAGYPLLVIGVVVIFILFVAFPASMFQAIQIALFVAPVWLPLLVAIAAVELFLTWRHSLFIHAQKYILLEIKPPRNLAKTPLAMEAVLAGFWHTPGEDTWWKKHILGRVRPYWSLEMASLEGEVHFYVWTRANFRKLVETAFYSQYPGLQLVEVPDYTRDILAHSRDEWSAWGCDFRQLKSDPYPIKTYVEYGLDKVQKEPEQVDPMANLVEFLGTMGKGEYLWCQFVIRTHLGEKYKGKVNAEGKQWTWRDEAQKLIQEIRSATRDPYVDIVTGEERPGFPNPTKGQSETMAALERNTGKLAFDVGIRAIYICKPEKFDPINITGIIGMFRQFSAENWNSLKAARWFIEFKDYPWEFDEPGRRKRYQRHIVDAYRRRQFYHEPYPTPIMTMSTEEVATLFHIPSASTPTPALPRIQSPTGAAPSNLPT